jgi:hypothetical protein
LHRESVRLAGLTSAVAYHADRLAEAPEVAGRELREYLDRIEALISRKGLRPEQLTSRTRAYLGWLRFMADPDRMTRYRDALGMAERAFGSAAPWRVARPVSVRFVPMSGSFSVRPGWDGTRVLLPTPMMALDETSFECLARAIFRRDRRRGVTEILHDIMLSRSYQAMQANIEALAGIVEHTRGLVHDLAESFQRVNHGYFDGQMPRPRLIWNRCVTTTSFGHYRFASDTVMISPVLDRVEIPVFVLDHVMHHELLHKKHGLRWQDGRGYGHTAEFRREERLFARYADADRILNEIARGRW